MKMLLCAAVCVALSCTLARALEDASDDWELKFQKIGDPLINPLLGPIEETSFRCPIRRKNVFWEAKDVFNPAAVVKDDKVYLLYRAEDRLGAYSGTSRIGLAWSEDGYVFENRLTEPVLYPAHDDMNRHEWDGGCEDPRVVESPTGEYVMTYTSYDGTARLSIATSHDLIKWEKRGPAFANSHGHAYRNAWTKSGSILVEPKPDGRLVAAQINGTYWMYWGENDIHVATSKDLISWDPFLSDDSAQEYRGRPDHQDLPTGAKKPLSVLKPRRGKFDSNLVEPGPPAILRDDGILFIYNSKNTACDNEENSVCKNGESDPDLAPGTYSAGQALFSRNDPTLLLKRSENTFFKPSEDFEVSGQVGNVCFLEGMVYFKNKWLLYYGTADSKIAVADSSDYDYKGKIDPRKRGGSQKKPIFHPVGENVSPEEISRRAYKNQKKSSSSETSNKKKGEKMYSSKEKVSMPEKPKVEKIDTVFHPTEVTDVTGSAKTSEEASAASNPAPSDSSVVAEAPSLPEQSSETQTSKKGKKSPKASPSSNKTEKANLRMENATKGSKDGSEAKKSKEKAKKDEDNFLL